MRKFFLLEGMKRYAALETIEAYCHIQTHTLLGDENKLRARSEGMIGRL
ncbi:hypothetical protein GW626_16795 [Peribacillus muralis]|nr:hypothetical protein [Peribacillus muralis]MCK1992009.1 hypothetical protein [Peribacillus muralis]